MSYPYCYQGPTCQLGLFFMMKCLKQPELACPFYNIGASNCLMVAFSGFNESRKPPPSGDARSIVPPHCNGHRKGQQSEYMLHHHFWVDCCPGSWWNNMERVVAQCRGELVQAPPDGGIQWLRVKPWTCSIGQCAPRFTAASACLQFLLSPIRCCPLP